MRSSIAVLVMVAAAWGCGGSEPQLTESEEYYVGRAVSATAISKTPLLDKQEFIALEQYVGMVGLTVAFESDRPETFKGYCFGVLQSDAVNAFAAPGGFIFVTTGALRAMENEDELAAVLGHEVAHVNLRHPERVALESAKNQGLMDALGAVRSVAAFGGLVAGALGKSDLASHLQNVQDLAKGMGPVVEDQLSKALMGYGRDSEMQADALAVDFLSRPGVKYSPKALADFVSRLPKSKGGPYATHPELDGRVQAIHDEIAKRGAGKIPIDPARTTRFKQALLGLKGP